MNRERAETFLRLLAEAELRHALTLQHHAGLSEARTAATMRRRGASRSRIARATARLHAARGTDYARLCRAAQVLTTVGAVDEAVAGHILDDAKLALDVRQLGTGGHRMDQLLRLGLVSTRPAGGPAGPQAAQARIVPLGQLIAFQGPNVSGELHLLSYARTALGPQLSAFARTRHPSGLWEPSRPSLFRPFTVTDDQGTSYQVHVRDIGSGPLGWTLMLRPDPPYEPRWLDLTTAPGSPAVRIDLPRRAAGSADMTVTHPALSPGEYLLHTMAARLLAAAWPVSPGMSPVTELTSGGPSRVAHGLGDTVAALRACDALPVLSWVPGQLATLCEDLGVYDHGITAPPTGNLPEPWLSLLACYRRRSTTAERDGCAAAAVTLPELDGISLALLGLHNCQDTTVLHMHAAGPNAGAMYGPEELYAYAATWIRDDAQRWHATRAIGRSGMDDGVALRVEVVPPLSRDTPRIDLLAAGKSAEIRATLPLRWQPD